MLTYADKEISASECSSISTLLSPILWMAVAFSLPSTNSPAPQHKFSCLHIATSDFAVFSSLSVKTYIKTHENP